MFTEALSVYVKPLIYQIKHTCINKVQNNELKKIQRDMKNHTLPK